MEQEQAQVNQAPVEGQQSSGDGGDFFSRSFSDTYNQVDGQQARPEQEQAQPERQENQPESNQDPDMYDKIERIARAERAAIEREMRAKREMEEAQRLREKYSKFENAYSLKDQDPMAAIEELGINFEDIQERYKNDTMPSSRREAELMKKVQDMETKYNDFIESQKKAQEQKEAESRRQQEQQQINQLMGTFKKIATETKDNDGSLKYELIEGENAYGMVFNHMEQEYQKTGKVLKLEDAMEAIEKKLEDSMRRVIKYNKFRRYGQTKQSDDQMSEGFVSKVQSQSSQLNTPNTINSNFVASNPPPSNRPMTREESIRRAAELIQFDD